MQEKYHQTQPDTDVWLVLGASGGIGGALLNIGSQDTNPNKVFIATSARGLKDTANSPLGDPGRDGHSANKSANIHWHKLDYLQPDTIDVLATWCTENLSHVDKIVCTTGRLTQALSPPLGPEKKISDLSLEYMSNLMQINALGPLLLLSKLTPLIKRSTHTKIAVLSAQVGSIEDNRTGGWYSYRMSKAALNMGLKSLAIESSRWPKAPIICAVHPGTTLTELSRPYTQRRTDLKLPDTTGAELFDFMQQMDSSKNGGFYKLDGAELPW